MKHTKYIGAAVGTMALAAFAIAAPAFAETNLKAGINVKADTDNNLRMGLWSDDDKRGSDDKTMRPSVVGKVISINGTTLVVSATPGFIKDSTSASTSFTVNASNATVRKGNATSSLSSIAVGDTVMVRGTITGTTVVATSIEAGMKFKGENDKATSSPIFTGNGQPVVAGTISAITGSTVTVKTKTNVTYTVDTSVAQVIKGNATTTLSSLAVGNDVVVQGTVNGTSIVASSIMTGKVSANGDINDKGRGFFGRIGHFFASLFGF